MFINKTRTESRSSLATIFNSAIILGEIWEDDYWFDQSLSIHSIPFYYSPNCSYYLSQVYYLFIYLLINIL